MTDPAIIAASDAAERNYSHNPDDIIDASGAVGAWGTTKESTTELSDLSGNGNIADINGPMPTEGFIQGRRYVAANSNYLEILDSNLPSSFPGSDAGGSGYSFTVEALVYTDSLAIEIATKYDAISDKRCWACFSFENKLRMFLGYNNGDSFSSFNADTTLQIKKWHYVAYTFDSNTNKVNMYLNGSKDMIEETFNQSPHGGPQNVFIARYRAEYADELIGFTNVYNCTRSPEEFKNRFNSFAHLPFWSVNYTDYPDNVTEYTDNLPYSSSIISSGTFKVDDDKLQCVSAGTMTYSASYAFDGSEYIKVEIDGVEHAGTGTITHGNTTVSVAQGSNKVTIQMGAGDTIEGEIGIQFREEV